MPMISGSPITLVNSSPSFTLPLTTDKVSYGFDLEFFDRQEFSHEKLRQAKNTDGSSPVFIPLFGGKVAQLVTTCGMYNTIRPVTPDDTDLANLKRRWAIKRYTLSGDGQIDTYAGHLFTLWQAHRVLLGRLQAHQAEVSGDISYQRLLTLQAQTFSYITSTTLSMYGKSITPLGKLVSPSLIGATSFSVTNAGDWRVAMYAIIAPGTVNQEVVQVTDVVAPYGAAGAGTITTTAASFAHTAGTLVQLYERNLLITSFSPEVSREIPRADGVSTVRKGWEIVMETRLNQAASA